MAWTVPKTWTPTEIPTATDLNIHLRDNLMETMVAKATQEGQIFVSTGVHAIAARLPQAANITTSQTTTSTTYTDLATVGPEVTVTHGPYAMVIISTRISNNTTNGSSRMSWAMSGSNVRAALNTTAIQQNGVDANNVWRIGNVDILTTLTPGTTTFTAKYNLTSGTGTYADRCIAVIPF